MKKVAIALLLIAGLAAPAMADQVKLLSGPYPGGTGGGEFTVQVYDNPLWLDLNDYDVKTKNLLAEPIPTFQTFCIDEAESISLNGIYNAVINTDAVKGGSVTGSDPLSLGTGYLYSQFAGGTLAGYAWSGEARKTSARDLQDALWYLEGGGGSINAFYTNLLTNLFGSVENAAKDGGWKYGVYALNLTDARTGGRAQDVLYYAPDGGATLMLLGGALVGLGALRRKLGR